MNLRPVLFALALVPSAPAALAAEPCSLSDDLSDLKGVAKVGGGGSAVFAAAPDKACAGKCAYVTPGDVVATGAASGQATCATFSAPGGRQTSGWLPTDRLTFRGGGPVFSGAFRGRVAAGIAILTLANDSKGRQIDAARAPADACRVKLALAGAVLLVHAQYCVGAGSPADFDGAYARRKT